MKVLARLLVVAFAACSEAPRSTSSTAVPTVTSVAAVASGACPVTRAVPPADLPLEAARTIINGSSHPEVARANLSMAGNDVIWATLPRGPAALDDRYFVIRLVAGQVSASARRLDGAAPPAAFHIPEGYGSEGLQVVGVTFPTPGCWELTYRLEGATLHELRITMLVEPSP